MVESYNMRFQKSNKFESIFALSQFYFYFRYLSRNFHIDRFQLCNVRSI